MKKKCSYCKNDVDIYTMQCHGCGAREFEKFSWPEMRNQWNTYYASSGAYTLNSYYTTYPTITKPDDSIDKRNKSLLKEM